MLRTPPLEPWTDWKLVRLPRRSQATRVEDRVLLSLVLASLHEAAAWPGHDLLLLLMVHKRTTTHAVTWCR